MSDNEKSLFWICVILTMAMAFTAIMISLPRTVDVANPTRLDYQGTIVAIFALLVTVLIGWQIYNAIGMEKRVFKAEKRIANLLFQLQNEKKKTQVIDQSSEDYSSGINCLSVAMIEYIQTLHNHKTPIVDKAKHYCTCYMVSASAITYFLASDKDIDLIAPRIELCVEGIDLSAKQLFSSAFSGVVKDVFTEDNHNTCDEYYKQMMQSPEPLGIDNINIINKHRSKRIALRD